MLKFPGIAGSVLLNDDSSVVQVLMLPAQSSGHFSPEHTGAYIVD